MGDKVFADNNRNGIQDAGDSPIPGVIVTLISNGTVVATTTTASSGTGIGCYSFTGLTPGVPYSVSFTAPAGFVSTTAGIGGDDTKDSDADPITGLTRSVTLADGENNPNLDAGFYRPTAGLGDYVFADNNKNGIQDAGDTPIPGVVVLLCDANNTPIASTTTNASGLYSFTGLTPGIPYSVSFVTPTGYVSTSALVGGDDTKDSDANPITGKTRSVTLAPGEFNPNLDAGFYIPTAGLGDYVFVDANKNGIQDAGDSPLPGVVVLLCNANNTPIASTTTNASGFYSFTGLTPGVPYSVSFVTPTGYVSTSAGVGGNDALDSDANPITGKTRSVTLANGEFNPNLDAGFYLPTASLGDYVFADNNKNGIQDAGDTPIPGVVVLLCDANNTPIRSTTTNASGLYSFIGLTPGVPYSVSFVTPTGYTSTSAQVGGDDTKDSDANPVTGKTRSVTLAPGENNPNLDAGFVPNAVCPTEADFNLMVSVDAKICNGESTTLIASSPVPNAKICWYLTPYAGTALNSLDSGQPFVVNPTTTTVYYAEVVTTVNGVTCVSGRKPVVVEVTTVPTPICLGNIKNTCPATTVDLTKIQIENQTTGLTYEWYTSLNRSEATRVTNLTAVGAGKFYLFARSGRCYSNPTVLTVEIVDCNCQFVAGVNVGPGVSVCAGDVIPLKAVLSGSATSVVWASNGTGTFSNPTSLTTTYTPSASDIATGNVLLTATTNDPDGPGGVCQAANSSLIAQINKRPDAPIGVACDDTLVCQGSSTKLIGFAPGAKINWYDQDGKLVGTTQSGGKLVVTPSKAGAVVYFAEAVSTAGCVSPRTSLTITVGTCLADLAVLKKVVTPAPYSVGQKITYAITVTNNGPITGTNVTVKDALPASLSYVSATPVGQYNPATGVWTIGTLTAGSDRSLLVEATVVGAGSITNTAIVGGSNNDPRYPQNDTARVTIEVEQCIVNAPTVVCAITEICKGGTTTLSARGCGDGTVLWSDGKTGETIFVSPNITTTYTASCVSGKCVSPASNPIKVTVLDPQMPVITASADNVCPGTSVTLTASGCEGGTIEWSEKAQMGASIVVTPNGKTTYTAQCRLGSCLSRPAEKTINISSDIPTPVIVCSTTVVCPGETVTLTVENCLGTPVWNSTTATTSSIVVTPTVGNNSYSVYCKNGACVSKSSPVYVIKVVAPVIPTITASADTVCAGGLVTLTATGCNGDVVWNVAGKTGASITVNPTANISYYAQCKFRTCLSEPSNTVNIVVASPAAPIVKVNKTLVCSGDLVSLTATGCNGTVQWQGVDKVGASIDIYPTETKEYFAVCKQGACISEPSNKVRVTVNTTPGQAPVVTASATSICNSGVVSLSATGCSGTVKWSDGQTGPVVSVTVTPTNREFYAICTPTSGTACGSGKSNIIKIDVTPAPTPVVTCSTSEICPGESVVLTVSNCQGIPYWSSTDSHAASITVTPSVTTDYSVYCQDGACKSATSINYTIKVTPVTVPTVTASATTVTAGGSVTLTASGCNGEVIWSANDINGNNKGASIVVMPTGTQTYYAQCKFRECLSGPSATITINPGDCIAKAGTLVAQVPTVCGGSSTTVLISATPNGGLVVPAGYSVQYLLTKGGVIVDNMAIALFTVPSDPATYTIHTLVYNDNPSDKNYLNLSLITKGVTTASDLVALIGTKCAALDATGATVNVSVVNPPVVLPGKSVTVCNGGIASLTATGCEGGTVTWSDGTVGAVYAKPIYASQSLMATCTLNGCTSQPSNLVDVVLGTPTVPIIVTDKMSVCIGETVSLTATGCEGGQYIWSDGTTVGSTLTITPTADVSFRVKCKVGTCEGDWSATTTIKVGAPATPTVSILGANGSTTVCFGAPVTLVAEGCSADSYVTWSNNQVGNSITVSPANSATFTAQCCTSNYCKSTPSNVLSVTVLKKVPQPVVADITNTCPMLTADLAKAISSSAATTGGLFEYYTDATLSDAAKVADPAHVGSGTFYVVEKTTNGCTSLPVMIHVQITTCGETTPCDATNPATADAGADASVCAAKVYQLAGSMGGAGKTAHWTTSGSGTFDNAFALNAKYTASAEDVLSGKVTLTLSVSTNNAACPVAKDDLLLTIDGIKSIPVVTVTGSTNLCFGDSVTLKAPAGAAGYKWSNNATTQNIVVKTSGTYSVQLLDGKGCSSVMSEGVTVKVNEPVMTPLVHNLRNTCPAKIVDLTTAVTKLPGLAYTYRICECVTSNIVMRPDSVCEGHYWVVAKNEAGCVSAPAKIEVKVFNCAADTLTADVSIAKLASTAVVNNGAPVAYTVKVTNAGPHTAKNIDVRDILPAGLELVPAQTADYKVSNGAIMKHIDSLKAGESVEIMYAARVTVKGKDVVNMAEITYLDNKDPNLANNTSSVTVKDTTTRRHSLIGLAKAVLGQPVAMGDSLIKVAYKFTVTNFGDDTLTHVNVGDDLAYTFGANTVTNAALALSGTSMLKLNPAFTGVGGNTQMLDSTSHIAPGKSAMFTLNVTVKRAAGDTTKSFNNFAMATAMNSMTTVSDLSVSGGDADPDNDGDPTNNTSAASFTLGTAQPQGPSIGLALAVVKTEMQPDSSFNVTYKATIKNFGDVALNGVVLTDSLIRAFAAPVSYSVVGAPMVGAGSTLVANTTFNGESQPNILTEASSLAAGVQDTVRITVNVKTNGNNGPFYSSATVVAHTPDMSQTVKDISNNGFDPAPAGSVSTTVRFDLPKGLIGVAKSVGTPTLVEEGVFDIPYTISVCNLGQVPLKKIQVVDKLSETFGNGALIVSSRVAITGTGAGASTLMIDSLYTGQGLITNMLVDSMSTLAVGAKAYLTFTVRVNVKNADSLTFYNTAMATALTPDNGMVEDASTAGTNDDPDNDLDPRNNSQPTPVTLNGLSTTSYMGLAMAVRDTARQADGSYNVTYQIVVKAYGPDPLRNVTVSDTLSKVFNAQTGSNFSVVNTPIITSTGSALKLNLNYNGGTDPVLVLGDSTSTLAAGKADTILVVVNVVTDGSTSTFLNSAYGSALAKTGSVSDVSTSGLNPDLNGNGNPTDANEREATPLNLQPVFATVFIPQGFSPNGDGINDLFVIRGANGQTVSLEVYNRWGHMVYKNDDYQNDWDGKPNTGIAVGSDANGVPDGTYYYVINLSDGRKFVRYMTINR